MRTYMKALKKLSTLLTVLVLTACSYDDSKLWEQVNQNTERIASLETWQTETNTNIQSLQTLLNTVDYITAVTPITEAGMEVGYTISFLNSPAITIYHGQKGEQGEQGEDGITPQIGITQGEDGNWYWTLNGKLMTDDQGNPFRANGETGAIGTSAPIPQLSTGNNLRAQGVTTDAQGAILVADAIYLSVNGGQTWTRISGEKGDNFFSRIDTTDPTQVTFIMADGTTTISIPRYTGLMLTFDVTEIELVCGSEQSIRFTASGSNQFTPDNIFVVNPKGWKTIVTKVSGSATEFNLSIIAPTNKESEGEILVMLDNGQGNTDIERIQVTAIKSVLDGTTLTAGALQPGDLAAMIGNRTDLTDITVTSGSINEVDWAAIVSQGSLKTFDLAKAIYTGTDENNLIYTRSSNNAQLISAKLPQGVTGLGELSFQYSYNLTSITLPVEMTSIGRAAFRNCYALTSITLPNGVNNIGAYAFAYCRNLTSITLPDEVTFIENSVFEDCESLTSIIIPDGVKRIGYAFGGCTALTTIICLATTPPTLPGTDVFSDSHNLDVIQVPANSVYTYQASPNWRWYIRCIQPIPK